MEEHTPEHALKQIEAPLRLTLLGLYAERLTRAFWPLWSVTIGLLGALFFGLQDLLPIETVWFATVCGSLAVVWALWAGWRAFDKPSRTEALARLDARLPGQPIAALLDSQSIGASDPASRAVWDAHRARMAERARKAQPVEPNLRLSSLDPFALRYVALTGLVMALLFGSVWRAASLSGLTPGAVAAAAAGPSWEGWAQPPVYTGKPALYLNDQTAESLTLPTGTRLQIRLYGEPGSLILSETVSARTTDLPPASNPAQDFLVTKSGTLAIEGTGGQTWKITAITDAPPTVTTDGKIGREADGRFKQPFEAKDDYGVTAGQVSIAIDLAKVDRRYGLAATPDVVAPVVLDLPLPLRGNRAEIKETLIDDLSKHVFANLPVTMTFSVTDAAGQSGTAAPLSVVLPGKRFFDPLAAALIEMRRDLLWSRSNAPTAVQIIKAVTNQPDGFIRNERAYLRLRVALTSLDAAAATLSVVKRDEIAEELWQIALLVEEGDLESAKERLRRAQDRVDEAIKNGASPEEVQELMDEMREALNNYLKELAESQGQSEEETSQNAPGMKMDQDQLQQMLDKLQQLMDEGKTAEAADLMEQLRQFMENMQVTQGEGGSGQSGPGQQAMKDLGETLRGQQGLSDDAFRDLQDGQEGDDGQQPGEDGSGKSLAERQKDLRERLGQMEKGAKLPGKGTEKGTEGRQRLGEAGRAMDEAEQALRNGDLDGALDRQAEAMEGMREGMSNFAEALAEEQRQAGEAQPGDQATGTDPNEKGRDPLGRNMGDAAHIGSDKNMLQGEDIYRRAQDLLDEIRKRSGDLQRPEGERNYLKRLLDLF